MYFYVMFLSERCTSLCFFFFFQAEDGIRDLYVTGVQTCALPISCAPTGRCVRSGQPCSTAPSSCCRSGSGLSPACSCGRPPARPPPHESSSNGWPCTSTTSAPAGCSSTRPNGRPDPPSVTRGAAAACLSEATVVSAWPLRFLQDLRQPCSRRDGERDQGAGLDVGARPHTEHAPPPARPGLHFKAPRGAEAPRSAIQESRARRSAVHLT